MKYFFAYFLLCAMTASIAASVWGQWRTAACYEWSEEGEEESQEGKGETGENKTEKESEKEFSPNYFDGQLAILKGLGRGKSRQTAAHDLEHLRSQCHGALPDMPPEFKAAA